MTDQEYLQEILKSQALADDSRELKDLIERRKHVEEVLRRKFPDGAATIRYGGSRAKGTLIREAYDLDIVCYFPNGNSEAGETLEDIYENVAKALEVDYSVFRKRSALRLLSREAIDFHIDVVPGRYTDDKKQDCFLYQKDAEKCRLKTNLDAHIAYVRDSGLLDSVRLLKLWKTRKALPVKQFVFELLNIDLLTEIKQESLPEQIVAVLKALRDTESPITVEDPANPGGNDLMDLLAEPTWSSLRSAADSTLAQLDQFGWVGVFGEIESATDKRAAIAVAVAAVKTPTRPWASESK